MRQSAILSILIAFCAAAASAASPHAPKLQTNADAPWDSGTYVYDGSGNIRAIGTDTYVYDAAGRIRSGTTRGGIDRQEYVYDAFGNRTASVTTSPLGCVGGVACDESVTIDPLTNRLSNGAASYDEAGNVTSLGNGHSTYIYDPAGMLSKQTDGANVREYVYSADDQRIAVYSNHEWLWSIRDPAQRVVRDFETHDGNPQWTAVQDYIYSDAALLGTLSSAGRRHLHHDHLGTTRLVTDDNARRLAEHVYYPFGTELQLTAESPEERMKFTGHERDTIPGELHTLDYMHARYYMASAGRFLSVDPVLDSEKALKDPQRWSRYSYVTNNPVKSVDPDGKDVVAVTTYDGPRTRDLGHMSWLFQDSKGTWYEYQQATDDSAVKALFGVAKAEADLREVAGADVSSKEIASMYQERYGADTSILKTTRQDDTRLFAAAQESVKSHNAGEKSYSLVTNNCGQAGVQILHKAGFTGAPSGGIPSMLASALNSWFMAVNNGQVKKTDELPIPDK